jgi:predicted  nucleic acid-binding Zn-ribbon protein
MQIETLSEENGRLQKLGSEQLRSLDEFEEDKQSLNNEVQKLRIEIEDS